MARVRHLTHAPIREALIDFQFAGGELDLAKLNSLSEAYILRGWVGQEIRNFEAVIAPKSDSNSSELEIHNSSSVLEGIGVTSADGAHVIQFRASRLTISCTRHYANWEDLEARARAALAEFVQGVAGLVVSRIGTRFINRIPPDPAVADYGDLLERPPLPLQVEGLEGGRISNFLRRHVVEGLQGGFTANLTIGTVKPEAGETTKQTQALVVDVDVFKLCQIRPDFESLQPELAAMRNLKNLLFFGSLKDEALERFV